MGRGVGRALVLWTRHGGGIRLAITFQTIRLMKTIALIASLTVVFTCTGFAQAPADTPAEKAKAAVLANDRAYEDAFAKADVRTLTDFFAEDAVYTADDGSTFTGRAAIEESIRAAFAGNKGATLAIAVDSVRVLSPDVVVEKGSTSVTAKSGEVSGALYTAIHVKKDGQWKISELVETPLPDVTPHDRLTELAWLIGEWEEADKTSDVTVRSQYVWARGGNFITRNVSVKHEGKEVLDGWQIIGWDPVEKHIRSWTFDGEGGFAEGEWTREGERWLLREKGVAPDGSRTTAENTFAKFSADRLTWESNNRTLDGEPQPSIARFEVNRVKGK
jgi:uncharacterized protein (TIGR02246 family)